MKNVWPFLVAFACLSSGVSAQQTASRPPLSSEQKEGRRIFQQKCAVCHVPISAIAAPYGPQLTKGLLEGSDSYVRDAITIGTARMPGWKYTLQAHQINQLIEYLRTIEKPSPTIVNERPGA